MKIFIASTAVLILIWNTTAVADTLVLKNGRRIETNYYWKSDDQIKCWFNGETLSFDESEVDMDATKAAEPKHVIDAPERPAFKDRKTTPRGESRTSNSTAPFVTKGGSFASMSEDYFDQVMAFAAQKDFEAVKKMIELKRVFILKPGIPVFVEDYGFWSGKTKIRAEGFVMPIWTTSSAIVSK